MQVRARVFDGENTQACKHIKKTKIEQPGYHHVVNCQHDVYSLELLPILNQNSVRVLSPKTHRGLNPQRNHADSIKTSRHDSSPLYIQVPGPKMLLQKPFMVHRNEFNILKLFQSREQNHPWGQHQVLVPLAPSQVHARTRQGSDTKASILFPSRRSPSGLCWQCGKMCGTETYNCRRFQPDLGNLLY